MFLGALSMKRIRNKMPWWQGQAISASMLQAMTECQSDLPYGHTSCFCCSDINQLSPSAGDKKG